MKKDWKVYSVFVLLTELVGIVSGLITRGAMEVYSQMNINAPLTPPAILFPIVWTVLYALMGIAAARIWLSELSIERTNSLRLYVGQLIVNFFLSIIFFNFSAYGVAFVWLVLLLLLIILMIWEFVKVDKIAARLLIPYIIWVTFAAYLNFAVWLKSIL